MKLSDLTKEQISKIAVSAEEKEEVARLLKIEELMERLETHKDFHYFGLGKDNDTTFGWYRQTLLFSLDVAGDYVMVRSIWTPPEYRKRGLCRDFLAHFYSVAQANDWNTAIVANPFEASRWDLVSKDYEGFCYTKDKNSRDAMAKLISSVGFKEISPSAFHLDEFMDYVGRVVDDYGELWPRYFVNRAELVDEDYQFSDDQFQRLIDWYKKAR